MADQNPSDTTPSLPPIPIIPFQSPSSDQPAPSTPTEMATASLSSSIESDLPISEVVAALKSASRSEAEIPRTTAGQPPSAPPTPVAPVIPVPPPTPASSPVAVTATVPVNPAPEVPKGPLYEDPDKVKVPGAL